MLPGGSLRLAGCTGMREVNMRGVEEDGDAVGLTEHRDLG